MSGIVRVAAAVVTRADGAVLLAQRPPGKPFAGYWEFPGGKLEPGETPTDALVRELHEELGLRVRSPCPWLVQEFVYPHAHVELHFFRVFDYAGEPTSRDGQAFEWQDPHAIDVTPLLPANARVLASLTLPGIYGITCASDVGMDAFIGRAQRALDAGLRLIQVREPELDASIRDSLAHELVRIAAPHGARIMLNGTAEDARRLACSGVHWSARMLNTAQSRPPDMLVAASCHTHGDLQRAATLDVDFVVLGPVLATPTHPHSTPLGWDGFGETAQGARVPVFALGGLHPHDLRVAVSHGAHGIAMRRYAWPE